MKTKILYREAPSLFFAWSKQNFHKMMFIGSNINKMRVKVLSTLNFDKLNAMKNEKKNNNKHAQYLKSF